MIFFDKASKEPAPLVRETRLRKNLIREGNEKANEAQVWHLEGEEKKRKRN